MTCARCGGRLRREAAWPCRLVLLACTACGDRTDALIWFHRRCQALEREINGRDPRERVWTEIQRQVAEVTS